jgi:hypothetical protein
MKNGLLLGVVLIFLCSAVVRAQTDTQPEVAAGGATNDVKTHNVTYVNPKRVSLEPGSVQVIKVGQDRLVIEYESMHKTGNFPIIRIQGIPFKLRKAGDAIAFFWRQETYELVWSPNTEKVALLSSEAFATESFSVSSKDVKNSIIYQGLTVETKRRDGVVSKLEVVDVQKDAHGKMEKFSVRTFADKTNTLDFHNENNILAPEFHRQYEKGINDEVLYIFTTDAEGQIFVYYR